MHKICTVLTLVLLVVATSVMAGHPDTSGKDWVSLFGKDLTGWMDALHLSPLLPNITITS